MIDWDTVVTGPCMAVFGEAVRYSQVDGAAIDITGVYDRAALKQAGIDGLVPSDIINTKPMLGVQLSQFPDFEPDQDDVLTIVRTGESYIVGSVLQDGHGWALLLLNVFTPPAPL